MKPYFERDGITIYHGDALAVMAELPTASCDVMLTDPPYSSGGMFRGDKTKDSADKYSRAEVAEYSSFGGDSRDQRAFMSWVATWSWQGLRIVRPSGHSFVFSDWRQFPAATDALQLGGWIWRGVIVWSKGAGGGIPQRGKFRQNAEYVAWGTHGGQSELADGAPSSIIEIATVTTAEREHVTQKPEALIRHLLQVVPFDAPLKIIDPFMGSGTTLRAALDLGHQAIGIDVDERYCEMAAERLSQGVLL